VKKKEKTSLDAGTIQFKLRIQQNAETVSDIPLVEDLTDDAVRVLGESAGDAVVDYAETAMTVAETVIQDLESIYDVWQPLADKVKAVVDVVDIISEVKLSFHLHSQKTLTSMIIFVLVSPVREDGMVGSLSAVAG
jgi:formyltetrahydrofolate synthetase